MNKKLIYGIVMPLLAIVLVSASILVYYSQFWTTLNITQQIDVNSALPYTTNDVIACDSGEFCVGDALKISNSGDSDKEVTITSSGCGDEADISYVGQLELTQKNTDTWVPIEDGITADIIYSVTGENFTVIGIPDEYTLIYYPNTDGDDFATNIANVLVYGVDEFPSLPLGIDVGDDYCNIGEPNFNPNAEHCNGAKLWLIPGDETEAMTKLSSWIEPETYLFETDLIYYFDNADGEIDVPAGSFITVYPAFDVEELAYGTCDALITIA